MKSPQVKSLVCLDGVQFSAVVTETSRTGEVAIKGATRCDLESLREIESNGASADLCRALDKAGVPKGQVSLALPRHLIIAKHFELKCGDLPDTELAPLIRLQLSREGTIDLESVVTDYTVLNRAEQTVSVLVAAVDRNHLDRLRTALAGAGRKITSIRIRTDGLASYVDSPTPTMVICPGPTGCEFAVISDGCPVSSRSSQDATTPAHIMVEADRTLLSVRTTDPSLAMSSPMLAAASGEGFPSEWTLAPVPPSHPGLAARRSKVDLALLGLAVEEPMQHRIDFANPHKPADRSAPARQRAMLVVFALIALIGTSVVLGKNKVSQLDAAIKSISTARTLARDSYRDSLVLDEISARVETQIVFQEGESASLPGDWTSLHQVRLNISGSADSRATIETLRETLLGQRGSTLSINGADTDDKFSLELVTPQASPKEAAR